MRAALLLLPALAACAPTPGPPVGRAVGSIEVRTFAAEPSGTALEVRGADCVAEAPGFRFAFRSPGTVPVPAGPARPVTLRCAAGGRSGEQVVIPGAATGTGVTAVPSIGIGIGSGGDVDLGIGAWVTPAPRAPGYEQVRVVLR
jgi:hypothetical protein